MCRLGRLDLQVGRFASPIRCPSLSEAQTAFRTTRSLVSKFGAGERESLRRQVPLDRLHFLGFRGKSLRCQVGFGRPMGQGSSRPFATRFCVHILPGAVAHLLVMKGEVGPPGATFNRRPLLAMNEAPSLRYQAKEPQPIPLPRRVSAR